MLFIFLDKQKQKLRLADFIFAGNQNLSFHPCSNLSNQVPICLNNKSSV